MIKSELISNLAAKMTNLSEAQVAASAHKIIEIMSDTLLKKQRIEIRGFGSFALRHCKARNAHNPKTGEKVLTKSKYRLHFKPGKKLRDDLQDSISQNIG